jgi:hypothetical protein
MAVGLITTSTDHGEIRPGWSQSEDASSHIIGEGAGATRQTTFSAQAAATSDLLLGEQVGVDGPFDSLGNVLGVTLQGDMVSTAAYDVDSMFLPVRDFPAVSSGFEEAALDLVQRLYGAGGVTLPWAGAGVVHAYYPMRGHNQGFTVNGSNQPYMQGTWGRAINSDNSSSASFYFGASACPAWDWVRGATGVWAKSARYLQNPLITGSRVNYTAVRFKVPASSHGMVQASLDFGGSAQTDIEAYLIRGSGTTGSIQIQGLYRQFNASSSTAITVTSTSTGSLDLSKEIQFVVQVGFLTNAEAATLRVKVYAYDPTAVPGGAPPVVAQVDLTNAMRSELVANSTWILGSNSTVFRDVILSQAPSSYQSSYYYPTVVEPATIGHSFTKTFVDVQPTGGVSMRPPILAWSGSGWDYLNALCAGRGRQMRVEAGQLMVRDIDLSSIVPVQGTIGDPRVELTAAGRARSIDIVNNKSLVSRVFNTVNFSTDLGATVRINSYTRHEIDLPPGEYLAGRVDLTIVDSTSAPVTFTAFFNRGGRCTPLVSGGKLILLVRGPKDSVNLGVGPWEVQSVRVSNQGFFEDREVVTLYTGAMESMVTRDKAGTVDNPFVNSTADVYDRGSWALQAGEPEAVLTFSVPESRVSLYPVGQIVSFGWATYRVMSVRFALTQAVVTAVPYTTVAQGDANATGLTVATGDAFYAGWRVIDGSIRPLASPAPVPDPRPFKRSWPSDSQREQ